MIPLNLHLKGSLDQAHHGAGKGRKLHDKAQDEAAAKDADREVRSSHGQALALPARRHFPL